jgi:hypothetical protein
VADIVKVAINSGQDYVRVFEAIGKQAQVFSVRTVKAQPPDIVGLTGRWPMTNTVLRIVLGAVAAESQASVDIKIIKL